MSAMEFLCQSVIMNIKNFSREERLFLETDLFLFVYSELNENFKKVLNKYLPLIKNKNDVESLVLSHNFIRNIISDIIATEEYTLSGIAYYLNVSEEVIFEIAAGINRDPSFELSRKILDLHKTVRKELYMQILSRIKFKDAEIK